MRSSVVVLPALALICGGLWVSACGSSSDTSGPSTAGDASTVDTGVPSSGKLDGGSTNTQMDSSSMANDDAGGDDSSSGDDDDASMTASDAGPGEETDGEAIYTDAGAGACTGLVNTAADVVQEKVVTTEPAATGGTLVAGLYYKIRDTIYLGPGGAAGDGDTIKETFNITSVNGSTGAAEMDSVILTNDSAVTNEHITFAPTGGANCNFVFDCPSSYGTMALQYSVRNTSGSVQLDVYTTFDGNRIETFELQH